MQQAHWTNPTDFMVSCIAMSVGIGNIWRFPFIAYENGGGAFLVAYIVVVCTLGVPLYFFELAIGEFSGKRSCKLFNTLAPAYSGIDALQALCTILATSYYCPLLAITLYYLVKSLTLSLPWGRCYPQYQDICVEPLNSTERANMSSSTELFFIKYLMKEPDNLDHGLGAVDWRLVLPMFGTWFGIFFVSARSVRSYGSSRYCFGLYPYFVLCIMLGVALAQKGSAKGLEYFFSPDWGKLLDAKVWFHAVSQCFFSLGCGFGTLTLLASYNSFSSDISMVSVVVPLIDTCTSLICGITVFAILGNMAQRLNAEVEDVIRSGGIGLLFIAYPEALSRLEAVPFVISVACFIMIYAIGFGSLLAFQEVTNGLIMEVTHVQYRIAAAVSSVTGCLLGIIYTTAGGMYIAQLVDYFGVAMLLYVTVFFEVLSVIYGYGLRNFCYDIEFMTARDINIWYTVSWSLITPISLVVIFCGNIAVLSKGFKVKGIEYPTLALICAWLLFFLGVIQLPCLAIYHLCKRKEEGCPKMFWSIFNYEKWAPENENDIAEWKASRQREETQDGKFCDFLKAIIGR